MTYNYTNVMDSVIYAGFKGHQYNIQSDTIDDTIEDNKVTVSELFKKEMDQLLKDTLKSNDNGIVLTLNQICDNKYLWFEKQNEHFDMLSKLISNGKLKISTYNDHDLISYTKKNLEDCLKRLCGGDISSDMVYISSLFPVLGIDNTPTPTRRRIEALLGWCSDINYDKEAKKFCSGKKSRNLEELIKDRTGGLYTAFLKRYSGQQITLEDCMLPFQFDNRDYLHKQNIKYWIEKLFELNEIAHQNKAFLPNVYSGFQLDAVIKYLLNEKNIIDKKLDFWLGDNMHHKADIKHGILTVLERLAIYKNRTSMYIHIRDEMESFAIRNVDKLYYNRFHIKHGRSIKYMPYQPVFYACLAAIDFAYNLLNTLYAAQSTVMLEYDFAIKRTGGVLIASNIIKNMTRYDNIPIDELRKRVKT